MLPIGLKLTSVVMCMWCRVCAKVYFCVCMCMCMSMYVCDETCIKERMTFKIGLMHCRFTHKHGALHIYIEFVRDFSTGLV